MKQIIVITFILLTYITKMESQDSTFIKSFAFENRETKMGFIGKFINGSIVLKWFPSDIELVKSMKDGFTLYKAEMNDINVKSFDQSKFYKLNICLPWNRKKVTDECEKYLKLKDSTNAAYLMAAYELTFNEQILADNKIDDKKDIMSHIKSVKQNNFFSIFSILNNNLAAEALGLSFTDSKVDSSKSYIYKLVLNNPIPNHTIKEQYFTVSKVFKTTKQEIHVKSDDKKLHFLFKNVKDFFSFDVFIKTKNEKIYKKINSFPILIQNNIVDSTNSYFIHTVDSLINFVEYDLKFIGKTIFAEQEEIGKCKGTPKDLTPPERPILNTLSHNGGKIASLKWDYYGNNNDLKGFVIYRSYDLKSQFNRINDQILPSTSRNYQDELFNLDTSIYYKVSAIDIYGNQSYSDPLYLTLVDSVPPAMPKPITGKMDSLGIVTLKMENQTEKDFMGYRIYKANADDHEFSVVQETYNDTIVVNARNTTIIDTSTLESLTKYVYYKVTALDYHYNESKFSPIIKVKRPDKIRPTSPLISDVSLSPAGVALALTLSSSEDVVVNSIFKRIKGEYDWKLIKEIKDSSYLFIDTLLKAGVKYEYTMNAKDDSGLISEYGNIVGIGGISYPVKVIQKFDGKFISNQNTLSWQIDKSKSTPTSYFIFRSDNKKGYRLIKKLESPINLEFVDKVIKENTIYDYVIQPRAKDIEYLDSDVLSITSGVQK